MKYFALIAIALAHSGCSALGHKRFNTSPNGSPLEPGLTYRQYNIGRSMDRLAPLAPDQTPNVDIRRSHIDWTLHEQFGKIENHFVVTCSGYLCITEPGAYTFRLTSDDGSRLMLNGARLIHHDGVHGPSSVEGTTHLDEGLHPFEVRMFENTGGEVLTLEWRPPHSKDFELVPQSAFRTERGVTRVVSPGTKNLLDGRFPIRPGDGMALDRVHPEWHIEPLRPDGFEPQVGGMAFLSDGRLVLSSFEPVNNGVFRDRPNGSVWLLEGVIEGSRQTINATQIADGFQDPAGVAVVNDHIYVAHRTDITRLFDSNGDGSFDGREVFASGWTSDNYHHFTFGLEPADGYLYGTLSTSIYFDNTMTEEEVVGEVISMNGPNPPNRGTCFRVDLETRDVEYLCGGFRTPNGLGRSLTGDIFVADNQGAWLPSSKYVHVQPGRFYGHYNGATDQRSKRYPNGGHRALHDDQPVSPPAVWLPQNECANSPTQSIPITAGPFTGQMYLAELTMGGIRRIFLEKVDGEFQGAVFRSCQGFEGGINRLIRGPDGCLYAGATGADGNWNWRGTRFGLQRLRPTGETAFEMHSVRSASDGLVVRFTRPVDRSWLEDPSNYRITQWTYHATPQYGGPKIGEQRMGVAIATAQADGLEVHLAIADLRPGHVVHLRTAPESVDGDEIWSTEAWVTLNRIPAGSSASPVLMPLGQELNGFRIPHSGWRAQLGILSRDAPSTRETIATAVDHGDATIHVDFVLAPGGRGGILLQGQYEINLASASGGTRLTPQDHGGIDEMLGHASDPDAETGIAPLQDATTQEFQTLHIVFRAARFDFDGNKIENALIVRATLNDKVIHDNVTLPGPTRNTTLHEELPYGPVVFCAQKGTIEFTNFSITLLSDD
jgi:hypothetical protein